MLQYVTGPASLRLPPQAPSTDRFDAAVERDARLLATESADIAAEITALRARVLGLSAMVHTQAAAAALEGLAELLADVQTDAAGAAAYARREAGPDGMHEGTWAE